MLLPRTQMVCELGAFCHAVRLNLLLGQADFGIRTIQVVFHMSFWRSLEGWGFSFWSKWKIFAVNRWLLGGAFSTFIKNIRCYEHTSGTIVVQIDNMIVKLIHEKVWPVKTVFRVQNTLGIDRVVHNRLALEAKCIERVQTCRQTHWEWIGWYNL